MTLEDLQTLLDYHYWSRDRMLEALEPLTPEQFTKDLGNSFKSIRDTLVHIYSAEWIWHSRWMGHSPSHALNPEDFPDLAAIRIAWTALEVKMRAFLQSAAEMGL